MHRPQALLVMRRGTFRIQFGPGELGRLRAAAELGDPVWAEDLETPAARARLAETEVLFTSWGTPGSTPPCSRTHRGCGPCSTAPAASGRWSPNRCGTAGSW